MWRPCGAIDDTYEKDLAIVRTRIQWAWLAVGLILLYLVPYMVSAVTLNTINYIAITIIALHGVNILVGMPIMWMITSLYFQAAINRLVELGSGLPAAALPAAPPVDPNAPPAADPYAPPQGQHYGWQPPQPQ